MIYPDTLRSVLYLTARRPSNQSSRQSKLTTTDVFKYIHSLMDLVSFLRALRGAGFFNMEMLRGV